MQKNKLVSFIMLLLYAGVTYAQWQPTNGPTGGASRAVTRLGSTILVSADGPGIYSSTNNGNQWNVSRIYNGSTCNEFTITPGRIYLNNTSNTFVYSNDTGKTWKSQSVSGISNNANTFYNFRGILFRGSNSYSTAYNNVHYSLDSGKTWLARVGSGSTLFGSNLSVNDFASIGSILLTASTYGVHYSADTGNTWVLRNGGGFLSSNEILKIVSAGTDLFAINSWGYVFRSADTARTWVNVTTGISSNSTGRIIRNIVYHRGIVLGSAVSNDTLYRYNNGLQKWEPHSFDIKGNYGDRFYSYGDTLYMSSNNGAYYSTNNGVSWTLMSGKINSLNLKVVALGTTVLAVDQFGKFHRSDNEGDTWYANGATVPANNYVYKFFKANNGLILMSCYNKLYYTLDTGRTWILQSNVSTIEKGGIFSGSKFVFTYSGYLYSSNDTAKTKTDISNTAMPGLANNINQLVEINGQLWIASGKFGLLKSADNGQTWVKQNAGLPSFNNGGVQDTAVYWIAKIGTVLVCRANDAGTGKNYISLNNGATWSYRSNTYMSSYDEPVVYGQYFICGYYLSKDTLATYTNFNTGMNNSVYYNSYQIPYSTSYAAGTNYIFAPLANFGVWRRSLNNLGTLPAAVSGQATALNQTSLLVSWNTTSNASSYLLEESTSATGPFSAYGTFYYAADSTYLRQSLSAGNTRYYRITTSNEFGSVTGPVFSGTTMARPLEPTVFTANGISTTEIRLKWQRRETTATKYFIERTAAGTCCSIVFTDSVNATDTTYVMNNLLRNSNYYFRIRCVDAGGYSLYAGMINANTLDTLPKSPVNLNATAMTQYMIRLTWADSSNNESGFVIERKDSATGSFRGIDSLTANIQSYDAKGLTGNTKYWFRVRAKNNAGYSLYTNTDSAVTYPAPVAPSALQILSVTSSSFNLIWNDNSNSETGYVIERATSATGPFTPADSVNANINTRTLGSLSANTRYFIRVKTKDAYGYSSYSNVADTTTLPNPPFAPSNLTASTWSSSAIQLNWNDNANNEEKFFIEMSLSPSSGFAVVDSVLTNVTTYQKTNLNAGTYYYFRIRAYNRGGYSSYAPSVMGITNPSVPAVPTNLAVANAQHDWVQLTWVDNSGNETGFALQRSVGTSGSFATIRNYPAGTTTGYDSSVISGTSYSYRVYATNTAGSSPHSNTVSFVVPLPVPAAPLALTSTAASHHTINLAWTDAATVTRYIIERSTGSSSVYSAIDSVSGTARTFSNTGLSSATSYTYRVRSYTASSGYSAYSLTASATTPVAPAGLPLPPNSLQATAVDPSTVTLTWRDSSSDESKFYIERRSTGSFVVIDSVNANITTYNNLNMPEGTTFTYRVTAVNNSGSSAYSNEATVTTPIDLAAPKGLYAVLNATLSVTLNWSDISSGEEGYLIERSTVSNDLFTEVGNVGMNVETFADVLPFKGTFYYRVRAKKGSVLSSYSNIAVVTNVSTGMAENAVNGVNIYPVPTSGLVHITINRLPESFKVTDLTGREMKSDLIPVSEGVYQVNLSGLNNGIYFVVIDQVSYKVIKN